MAFDNNTGKMFWTNKRNYLRPEGLERGLDCARRISVYFDELRFCGVMVFFFVPFRPWCWLLSGKHFLLKPLNNDPWDCLPACLARIDGDVGAFLYLAWCVLAVI